MPQLPVTWAGKVAMKRTASLAPPGCSGEWGYDKRAGPTRHKRQERPRQTTRTTNERALARQPTRGRQSRQSRCISAFHRFSQILAPSLRGARALISSVHHDSPREGVGGTFQHSSRPGATAGHDNSALPMCSTFTPFPNHTQRCESGRSHRVGGTSADTPRPGECSPISITSLLLPKIARTGFRARSER